MHTFLYEINNDLPFSNKIVNSVLYRDFKLRAYYTARYTSDVVEIRSKFIRKLTAIFETEIITSYHRMKIILLPY